MSAVDTLQLITLVSSTVLVALGVFVLRRIRPDGYAYAVPALSYLLVSFAYYVIVIFFRDATTGDWRMLGSVVLRLMSHIMAGAYLLLVLHAWRRP
jgi:hypothetical protein